MTIYGIFLNNEIRTGGHARYLRLLNDLAEKGCAVVLYHNSEMIPDMNNAVARISVEARYVHGKIKNMGSFFAQSLRKTLTSSNSFTPPHVPHLLQSAKQKTNGII